MTVLSDLGAANSAIPTRTLTAVTGAYYLIDYVQAGDAGDWTLAWNRFQAALPSGYSTSAWLVLPAGDLSCLSTWHIWRRVRISGTQHWAGTTLIFPKNTTGIRAWSTSQDIGFPGPENGRAGQTVLENFAMSGQDMDYGDHTGHGVHMGVTMHLRNLNISGFSGHGVYCHSLDRAPGYTGNSNCWSVHNCIVRSNGVDGLHMGTGDGQAGVAFMVFGGNNNGWDFFDDSWAGNTYIACHSDAGLISSGSFKSIASGSVYVGCYNESKAVALSGCVVVGGNLAGFVDKGQTPSLEVVSGANPGSGATAIVNRVSDPAGAILSVMPLDYGSGYDASPLPTVVLSKEGGGSGGVIVPVVSGGQIKSYTISAGGTGYVGTTGGMATINNPGAGMSTTGPFSAPNYAYGGRYIVAHTHYEADAIYSAKIVDNLNNNNYEVFDILNFNESYFTWNIGYNGGISAINITGKYNAITAGRASAISKGMPLFANGLWLGFGSTARQVTNGTAAPTTGQWARGDIVWNTAPSAGGSMGWMCTTTGDFAGSPTPVFKAMPNLAA